MDFKKWVKSIQTAGYNGARTVSNSYFKNPTKIKSLQKEMQEEIESHSRIQGPGNKTEKPYDWT